MRVADPAEHSAAVAGTALSPWCLGVPSSPECACLCVVDSCGARTAPNPRATCESFRNGGTITTPTTFRAFDVLVIGPCETFERRLPCESGFTYPPRPTSSGEYNFRPAVYRGSDVSTSRPCWRRLPRSKAVPLTSPCVAPFLCCAPPVRVLSASAHVSSYSLLLSFLTLDGSNLFRCAQLTELVPSFDATT